MRIKRKGARAPSVLFLLVIGFTCFLPLSLHAASFDVDGLSDTYGLFPFIGYGLVQDDDILPVGDPGYGLGALFDTGSTKVRINDSGDNILYGPFDVGYTIWYDDADILGVTNSPMTVDVRASGLGATTQTPNDVLVPLQPAGSPAAAQADVQDIGVVTQPDRSITLIGTPVADQVQATIDYTNPVARTYAKGTVTAPDITLNPEGTIESEVVIDLVPFGTTSGDVETVNGTTIGPRYFALGVEFNEGIESWGSPLAGEADSDFVSLSNNNQGFLYDTGTNVTLISQFIATTVLGLELNSPDFTGVVAGNNLPGYGLDSIVMTGLGGTYTVNNAQVIAVPDNYSALLGSADAIIGSNLFMQTSLLFDGPADTLGIGASSSAPVPEPATLLLFGSGLVGLAAFRRKFKSSN